MKDEIKEVLDKLNSGFWEKDEEEITYKILFSNEVYQLLDYITNLQEEKDKYKLRCYKAKKMIFDNYGLLDKYGIEMLEDILDGKSDE